MESMVVVTPRGTDFEIEVAAGQQSWFEDDAYEPLSTALWQRLSRISDQIVDIGAHVGWYTVQASRSNPNARVIAVEGGPQTADVCRRNCESVVPGKVTVHNAVFASTPGFVEFHLTEASDDSSRTGHPSSPTVEILRRPVMTGRDLGLEAGHSLLIKIDVEGHELDALQGLAEQIEASSSTRIILELNPKCLALAGSSPESVLGWLRAWNFKVYRLDDRVGRWAFVPDHQAESALVPEGAYVNLYCVRGAKVVGSDFVLHSSALGGAERSTLSITERLSAAGHLVHCYLPDWDAGLGARLEGAGVTVSRYPGRWWAHADTDVDWTQAAEGLELILADLRDFPTEVVVTVTGVVPVGALAARLARLPHVWSLHEYLDDDHGLALPASRQDIGEFILEHSDAVVANSDSVARHVLGRPADRIVPPLDMADVERIPLGDVRVGAPRVLGFFSSLNPPKGLQQLVEALALLVGDGRDVLVSVYGEGPLEEAQAMAALAERIGIADRITFHGRSDEPLTAMSKVDVVVMPSWREAFGRVPIEAVMVGRPVVYARGSGMDDYMRDGVTGVACDSQDPVSLAGAIARVLDDAGLRQVLAQGARPALETWLGKIDRVSVWESLLVDASARRRTTTWSEHARSTLILEASAVSVAQQVRLAQELDRTRQELDRTRQELDRTRQELDRTRHDLDLVAQDRQAVDADRQRLHQSAESSQAELARIRSTLRYRSTFGWRSRLKVGRISRH